MNPQRNLEEPVNAANRMHTYMGSPGYQCSANGNQPVSNAKVVI